MGAIGIIGLATDLIVKFGPVRGYFMDPEKLILVYLEQLPETELASLSHFKFTQSSGTRYLSGFMGTARKKIVWLQDQVEAWKFRVRPLAMVAHRFPQTAYAGLTKSIQLEWQYLQRAVPDLAETFAPVEIALREAFCPP